MMKKQFFMGLPGLLSLWITVAITFTNCSKQQTKKTALKAKQENITVNGQNFFPIGFYGIHVSDTYENRIACMNTISSNGFNTVVLEDIWTDNFGSFLDHAEQLGNLKVMVGLGRESTQSETDVYIQNSVNTYKNKPALLGWIVSDDADDGSHPIFDLIHRNNLIKSIDPRHNTFLSLTGYYPERRRDAAMYTDITNVCLQMYPITPLSDYDVTAHNALTETYERTLQYVQAAEQDEKFMIMTPQTFKWREEPGHRYPTVLELRNMCYSGICAGVNGLIAYDFSFDLFNNQKSLWNEYVAIKDDIITNDLKEYFMQVPVFRYDTNTTGLYASYWKSNTDLLLIVVNTNTSSSKSVSIILPTAYSSATSLFGRMPKTLSLQNKNKIVGNVAAKQVLIYKLQN